MPRPPDHSELPPTAGLPLRGSDLIRRPKATLPAALSGLLQHDEAIVTCSGTAALIIALTTLARNSPRREVIVPAWTCPLVAIAVAHCGLTLRLCDLRTDHFDMDHATLDTLCSENTLAILPTHLGGRVADVAGACAIAHRSGAWIIEDAAQALGARHADGTAAGMLGDIGIYSLAAGKGLSTYEGGLLLSRHADLHRDLRSAASNVLKWRPDWELRRCIELLGYAALYRPRGLRYAYGNPLRRALRRHDTVGAVGDRFPLRIPLHRLGTWRQRVGTCAATRLPNFLSALHTQAQPRMQRLRSINGMQVMDDEPDACGTWPFLMLLLPDRASRDAALDRLWRGGLGVSQLFVHALPDYEYLHDIVPADDVPHARDFAARSLTIGNSPWLDDATFARIADTLEETCAVRHR